MIDYSFSERRGNTSVDLSCKRPVVPGAGRSVKAAPETHQGFQKYIACRSTAYEGIREISDWAILRAEKKV